MVRVLIERKLKKRENISKMIREIRSAAMAQPGYISSETMVDVDDRSALTIITTWINVESWKKWETSRKRAVMMQRDVEPLLEKPEKVRIYEIISIDEMDFLEDPEGWLRMRERSLDG